MAKSTNAQLARARTKGSEAGKHKAGGAKKPRVKIATEDLPRRTLEACLAVPRVLHNTYAGKSATWEEIATAIGVSATNPNNRYELWAATGYGVIKKESQNSFSLAEKGRKIVAPNHEGEDNEAIVQAIQTPTILGRFYADYDGSPVPADTHLLNVLENRYGVPRTRRQEAADIILENARFAGILQELPQGKRSISLSGAPGAVTPTTPVDEYGEELAAEDQPVDYSKVCFLITPIGSEDSEERKHADLIMKHLVCPVLESEQFGLTVVRADRIGRPGIITQQIIEHLALARLCIADLSFNNPNAFYEIGVRHTLRLPTIQIIRSGDKIPFDVSQGRTITVDTSDRYTIMDKFASASEELKEHVAHALASGHGDARDNPVSYYLPGVKVEVAS